MINLKTELIALLTASPFAITKEYIIDYLSSLGGNLDEIETLLNHCIEENLIIKTIGDNTELFYAKQVFKSNIDKDFFNGRNYLKLVNKQTKEKFQVHGEYLVSLSTGNMKSNWIQEYISGDYDVLCTACEKMIIQKKEPYKIPICPSCREKLDRLPYYNKRIFIEKFLQNNIGREDKASLAYLSAYTKVM